MAAPESEPPRFESLPPEVRNMIYKYLLPPARLQKERRQGLFVSYWSPQYQDTYVLETASTAIRRTNRNINREASAILYRNTLLVSIDWNLGASAYLRLVKMPQRVAFNYARPGASLPPCVVRVQHQFHDENSSTATTSTIVAAEDFPVVCSLLLRANLVPPDHLCEARTSYSVISLPVIGYNVDRLRELIWYPLKALREGRSAESGERTHRNLRAIDCTGVFEEKAAMLDRDRESDDGNGSDGEDESDEDDGDKHDSDTDAIDEEDSLEEDSDDEDSQDEDSGGDGDGKGENDDEEDKSVETTNNQNGSNDVQGKMSHSTASEPGHDGNAIAKIVVEDKGVAGRRPEDVLGHIAPSGIGSNGTSG